MTHKQPPSEMQVFIPALMRERGKHPMDLVRDVGIAIGTAYKLYDPETASQVTEISNYVIVRLCKYFNVPSSQIMYYDPNSVDSG
jgi:DNA-binding Xre family transcriptional regulator